VKVKTNYDKPMEKDDIKVQVDECSKAVMHHARNIWKDVATHGMVLTITGKQSN
jgi:hypothetical protein